nr:MAK10-like protein [Tanacetum cinerariifolium]
MSILPQGEPSISWQMNDPRDIAKPVKAISLPHDVPSSSDRRLIELERQVQRLIEVYLALKSSVQVNKIASSYEICSGPHETQYCMENPEQAFVDYASSSTDEAGGKQKKDESRETCTIRPDAAKDISHEIIIEVEKKAKEGLDGSKTIIGEDDPRDIKQNKTDDRTCGEIKEVDEVEIESEESKEEIKEKENDAPENFDTFPTIEELGYHEWLLKNPRPPWKNECEIFTMPGDGFRIFPEGVMSPDL